MSTDTSNPKPRKSRTLIIGLALGIPALVGVGAVALLICGIFAYNVAYPTMPLEVTTRPSLWGSGVVVQLTNTSDENLHGVELELYNAKSKTSTSTVILTIAPHSTKEIGWLELTNWTPLQGEYVTLKHTKYRSIKRTL